MSNPIQQEDRPPGVVPGVALVYALFFLSGVAALVYEASWARLVGLAAGNTAQAASLVLVAMFVGLGVGQFLGGLLAGRVRPLLAYGVAELVAAAWACLVPALLGWAGSSAGDAVADVFRDTNLGRSALCVLALLPATIPLGATLPFVLEAIAEEGATGPDASFAYGVNTAGGLVGIVAASSCLLVVVGVRASGQVAALLSAGCGVVACVAAFVRPRASSPPGPADAETEQEGGQWGWPAVAAISGFGVLGLEALFTRMFALVFHNSTYTFGAVVAAFLLALSVGAAVASRLGRVVAPWRLATAAFSLGGLAAGISAAAFPRVTGLDYFSCGETFTTYIIGASGLVALFVLPPVTLLGLALPAALQAAEAGKRAGTLTAVNTLAAAAGALAAGLFLPPLAGLWPSFGLFVLLFVLCGALLLARDGMPALALCLALCGAGTSALIVLGPASAGRDAAGEELVRRWESAYGWVDVVRSREGGSLAVRQNLHYRHGSTTNAAREYLQGRLPLLLHPGPKDAAFLGLGTGLTAAPALVDRGVEGVVVVELVPEVVEASRLLASANLGVADHPKAAVVVDDARHYLHRTQRRFDVVVSDLFVPWEDRAGYLYTVEFYQSVRRRLKPGGLFCQWLALYQVGPEQLELIADSFSSVFPNTTIWWGQFDSRYAIVALVGAEGPLVVGPQLLEGRFDAQRGLPGQAGPELRVASDLPALFLGSWARDSSRRLNTDEHPWLEYTAPVSQRSGLALRGPALRAYFGRVFAGLPSEGVRFGGELDALGSDRKRRHALQQLSLFGEVGPGD